MGPCAAAMSRRLRMRRMVRLSKWQVPSSCTRYLNVAEQENLAIHAVRSWLVSRAHQPCTQRHTHARWGERSKFGAHFHKMASREHQETFTWRPTRTEWPAFDRRI